VVPFASYDVGGRVHQPSNSAPGFAGLVLEFFASSDCSGDSLPGNVFLQASNSPETFDTWQLLSQDNAVAPAGAKMARILVDMSKFGDSPLARQIYLDMIYLSPAPDKF
jgi:hypothetical protein